MQYTKILCAAALLVCTSIISFGQGVGINNPTPAPSAILDLTSNIKGFLVPRMTNIERLAIASPATGLLVYETTTNQFFFYDGTAWRSLLGDNKGWLLSGNAGTSPATNFLGTTDNQDLVFRRNSVRSGWIAPTNTSFGNAALASNISGINNIAVGSLALNGNFSGSSNIAIGNSALRTNGNASHSVAIGDSALLSNNSSAIIAIGSRAGFLNNNGLRNTYIGFESGRSNSTGSGNTTVGYMTLRSGSGISNNVAVGDSALHSNVASGLTAVGSKAGVSNTIGTMNTFIGFESGRSNSTGSGNTTVGYMTLRSGSGINNNVAVGDSALHSNVASGLTAVGSKAGVSNNSGIMNTYIGFESGRSNTYGSSNTVIGYWAMRNSSGSANVVIGDSAMLSGSGYSNTVVGSRAGADMAYAYGNTFIGYRSGWSFVNGYGNTFVGSESGRFVTGNNNSLFGQYSGENLTTGTSNTLLGHRVGMGLTDGSSNTMVGYLSGRSSFVNSEHITLLGDSTDVLSSSTNATAVGSKAAVSGSNQLVLGSVSGVNGATSNVNVGMGTTNPQERLHVVGRIRMVDGNQAAGKVLISDINGTGSWGTQTASDVSAWGLSGNSGTTSANFIGTIDNQDIRFRRDGNPSGFIGVNSTSLGYGALPNPLTAAFNTVIGFNAMNSNISGISNVAVGSNAMASNLNGNRSVAVGDSALFFNTASGNTAIGAKAGRANTTGVDNTIIGFNSGFNLTSGGQNVLIGVQTSFGISGTSNASGNVLVGYQAGLNMSSVGNNNVLIGKSAGGSPFQIGTGNVLIGEFAGSTNATLNQNNTILGKSARVESSGNSAASEVTILGSNAVAQDQPLLGLSKITLLGSNARSTLSTNATAIGADALASGNNMLVLGSVSGVNGAAATVNVGIGNTAPVSRFHVRNNGTSGAVPSVNVTAFFENNDHTYLQLMSPSSSESGLIFGNPASTLGGGVFYNFSGLPNGLILRSGGTNRLYLDATGNLGIGVAAPAQRLEIAGNVFSISGDFYGSATNGVINMGGGIMNGGINVIADIAPAPLNANGDEDLFIEDALEVGGQGFKPGGGSWAAASDARLKRDVQPYTDGLNKILAIRPVSFKYNDRFKSLNNGKTYIGVIAQEIREVAPYTVELSKFGEQRMEDESGVERVVKEGEEFYTYDSSALTYMLINAVKELKQQSDDQRKLIEELLLQVEQLKQQGE